MQLFAQISVKAMHLFCVNLRVERKRLFMIKLGILLFAAFLFPVSLGAGPVKSDTSSCLLVDGKIINAGEGTSSCRVELIDGDKVVESLELKGNRKKFVFNLRRDRHYIIRMSKEGFVTKNICVHTALPAGMQQHFKFEFETRLSEVRPTSSETEPAANSPVASIYYHEKKQCFFYHKSFSSYYQKQHCKLYTN